MELSFFIALSGIFSSKTIHLTTCKKPAKI